MLAAVNTTIVVLVVDDCPLQQTIRLLGATPILHDTDAGLQAGAHAAFDSAGRGGCGWGAADAADGDVV